MINKYTFKLTEEIARWAFEIQIAKSSSWFIAFSNPTAGPWKRLMGRDPKGAAGEVHRFEREEERPDLVLVCDSLQLIVILEAKDSLDKLAAGTQVKKSGAVVMALAKTLRGKEENKYWGRRVKYTAIAGLLWGAEYKNTEAERKNVFAAYESFFKSKGSEVCPAIIGIESHREDAAVSCAGYVSNTTRIRTDLNSSQVIKTLLS